MNTLTAGDRHAVVFQTYQKVTGSLMANSHPGSYSGQDAYQDMFIVGEVCTGADFRNASEYPEEIGTIQAGASHNLNSNNVVRCRNIVRRLTPTECARLQGFPDNWGHPDSKEELTDAEYEHWCKVNLEYAMIQGTVRPDGNGWYEIWRKVKPDKEKVLVPLEPYWENTGKQYAHKNRKQMLAWYNKLHTDSAEYKMWGNGIALPPALYVMQGIVDALQDVKA